MGITILAAFVLLVAAATTAALLAARGMGRELARLTLGQDGDL